MSVFSYYRIQSSDFIKAIDYQTYLVNNLQKTVSLFCPEDLFWAGGPIFWQQKEAEAQKAYPEKSIILWGEVGLQGGYALGALRMGFRHLVVSKSLDLFYHLQSCAKIYNAQIKEGP